MESSSDDVITLANGEIVMWIDAGTLHLKCITRHGDPVELNTDEVVELLETLQRCVRQMD